MLSQKTDRFCLFFLIFAFDFQDCLILYLYVEKKHAKDKKLSGSSAPGRETGPLAEFESSPGNLIFPLSHRH